MYVPTASLISLVSLYCSHTTFRDFFSIFFFLASMTSLPQMVEQWQRKWRPNVAEVKGKRTKFCINDHVDVLIEILNRLDGRSLGVAACVCRLWCSITRNDSFWEHLCFRHLSPPPPSGVRPVVVALGGYRRLYMMCLRPVLSRLAKLGLGSGGDSDLVRRIWTRHEVELSLSLFCVDYYERLGGGRLGDTSTSASASSLMFLCKPVNVGLDDF